MFPGVGSHYTGMGKEFYDNFSVVKETFEEASDTLGVDFPGICFYPEGKEELNKLENSQTSLVTLSVATYRVYMQEIGILPDFGMGHSLGEYSALCSAGIIKFADTLVLVKQRGIILNEVAKTMDGMMAWVINLDNKIVVEKCREISAEGRKVFVSAYDAPTQSSISGLKDDVITVGRRLEKEGAIVYPLKLLEGPFHSPFMKEAAGRIKSLLDQYEFEKPRFPVVANYNGLVYGEEGKESVINSLSLQLVSPIRWQASLEYVAQQGAEIAFEIGPNKVLKHLVQNNNKSIRTYSLENMNDLKLIEEHVGKQTIKN
jgi:[acyl-carrier-protein] S-malonyltransferase